MSLFLQQQQSPITSLIFIELDIRLDVLLAYIKPKLVFKYPQVNHLCNSWNDYRIVNDAEQTLILNQVQITNISKSLRIELSLILSLQSYHQTIPAVERKE